MNGVVVRLLAALVLAFAAAGAGAQAVEVEGVKLDATAQVGGAALQLNGAGWMAMSRDRGTQVQAVDHGYGAVCDEAGRWLDDFVMTGANQEHGIVALRDGGAAHDIERRFPLGTRLRILPNPACATAAQYSSYAAIAQDGGLATWERFGGW